MWQDYKSRCEVNDPSKERDENVFEYDDTKVGILMETKTKINDCDAIRFFD